jgi:hypothetical protein
MRNVIYIENLRLVSHALLISTILLTGIFLRMALTLYGHNYDVLSYRIVADIMLNGGNVYAETGRYNYAPIWFLTLRVLDLLPSFGFDALVALRTKVAALLTLTDVGIFVFLLQRYGLRIATLFFLNPISIIITGYHSQFDNVAIFVAIISVSIMDRGDQRDATKTRWRWALGLVGLGLSLCIKHVLFMFPFWLALKEQNWRRKILIIAVPIAIFLVSFAPYWNVGHDGIIHNVFQYRSFQNGPLWYMILPHVLYELLPKTGLFIVALALLGIAMRPARRFDSLLVYLVAVVVFSSSLANQYLAIPVVAIAVMWNTQFRIYTFIVTIFLLLHGDGLGIVSSSHSVLNLYGYPAQLFYGISAAVLGAGLAIELLDKRWHRAASFLWQAIVGSLSWMKKESIHQIRTPI